MIDLYARAQRIDRLADYIECAGIARNNQDVSSAARYQLECALSGESGRWEDATRSEINALRRFVERYCQQSTKEETY